VVSFPLYIIYNKQETFFSKVPIRDTKHYDIVAKVKLYEVKIHEIYP